MINLRELIEKDDLETFKKHFDIVNWKNPVSSIPNYAGLSEYKKEITYDEADSLKYALHMNADKIFNYLLPLLSPEKHSSNYGFPLLAMALINNRYDYANSIINHPKFDPYPIYNTNTFNFIKKRTNINNHIEFLFNYLEKFDKWDFKDKHLIYKFVELACYNEETYSRFENIYKIKMNDNNALILEDFKEHIKILAGEIFNKNYNDFIIKKLSNEDIKNIIEAVMDNNIFFISLFKSEYAKNGILNLLKAPESFKEYLKKHAFSISYLPLDCILLLVENGVSLWEENHQGHNALDYILDEDNINDEKTLYFMNKYPQELFDRLEKQKRKNNIQKYCHQKLLQENLPHNKKIKNTTKI